MINGVPSNVYPKVRKRVMPFLENFAKRSHGRWTVDGLESSIMNGEKQCWSANDFQAVILTSLGNDEVNIEAAAGVRRKEWQDAFDSEIKKWARHLGKSRIIAKVRPGWSKYGQTKGYKVAHYEMILEL